MKPTPEVIQHSLWIHRSYQQHLGVPLIVCEGCSDEALATRLYEAPFVLLAQDDADDPTFNYANQAGQFLWGMDWQEFVRLKSRFSAEPLAQEERRLMLQDARRKGYITNYQGIRVSRSGRRFRIIDATLWNVYDNHGIYAGQAVMFERWTFLT